MLRYIDFQHSEKLQEMRFKLSKLKQQFGIDSSILQERFLEDDRHFVSELQLAIGLGRSRQSLKSGCSRL